MSGASQSQSFGLCECVVQVLEYLHFVGDLNTKMQSNMIFKSNHQIQCQFVT